MQRGKPRPREGHRLASATQWWEEGSDCGQGAPSASGLSAAGPCPVSACCVSCCSVVRFKNGQGSNLDGGNYHVYENGSLEIRMIRKEDQGIYTCVATNILGKAENQVRLEVKGNGAVGGGGAAAAHSCARASPCT